MAKAYFVVEAEVGGPNTLLALGSLQRALDRETEVIRSQNLPLKISSEVLYEPPADKGRPAKVDFSRHISHI